jgi:hypothetical protein
LNQITNKSLTITHQIPLTWIKECNDELFIKKLKSTFNGITLNNIFEVRLHLEKRRLLSYKLLEIYFEKVCVFFFSNWYHYLINTKTTPFQKNPNWVFLISNNNITNDCEKKNLFIQGTMKKQCKLMKN